jgi:hypothetical protein
MRVLSMLVVFTLILAPIEVTYARGGPREADAMNAERSKMREGGASDSQVPSTLAVPDDRRSCRQRDKCDVAKSQSVPTS